MLNLSQLFVLSRDEQDLLERGLSFIPTPLKLDKNEIKKDLYEYHRRLKLLHYFDYEMSPIAQPFVESSKWEPKWELVPEELQQLIHRDRMRLRRINISEKRSDNLTVEQRRALSNLTKRQDVIFKPADKGSKIVILDKTQYLIEANRQLQNGNHYRPLSRSLQSETQVLIRGIVEDLYRKKYISSKQRFYLFGPYPPRPRKFYLLPKIHKDPGTWTVPHKIPPGRPIVSDCGSESYRVAEYIDHFLNPLSQRHESYIKDTYEFVNKIKTISVPAGALLFTIDIDALYTNINTHLGLQAVAQVFNRYPDPERPDEALLQLLKLGLTRNDFVFDSRYYLQIHGTAMGKRFAPSYANIYMADWERTLLPKCHKIPLLYVRYLDDIFGIWTYSEQDFKQYINTLNSHHDSINVKYNLQHTQIEFLDTEVFFIKDNLEEWMLGTRVYFKPTDTHALLHKNSFHPRHTFRGIVKSQLIRFHRICTRQEDAHKATKVLFNALKQRGYGRTFLRSIKNEVERGFEGGEWITRVEQNKNLVPLVTSFSSASLHLNSSVKSSFKRLQCVMNPLSEFKVISAFKRNKNLQDMLVHATLAPHKTSVKNSHTKNSHFKNMCFVQNRHTGSEAAVWQKLHLNSKNVVYLIECMRCNMLYVGQTKNILLDRLKQHLYHINNSNKATVLYEHFRSHGAHNLRLAGLESNPYWSVAQRLRAESLWITKLKTGIPNGLNEAL